ncbi:hypothetical protein NJE21_004775 [Salmonella enterica subsp. enterica serovar Derby]|nr:hypothetical protein [Salmonella enterica subsp. enterica serovar Derby]EEK5807220.1 hypothetical protein [Salmonella enterica]EFJ2461945.1 hypothetical protein [Escherichia coli]EGL7489498.1 hypothetical protein [Salmonella enterica subsp. enterica serovar Newport]EHP2472139.1 hypothetical protein [Salmonella enterica subsp. enterica serovar Kentucky]EHP2558828.1 hypothetical protein [Salmonella enterica subsp. enterica serovar Ohio]EIQ0993706.1 hypothetical protein [Salmonella enterica s
MSWIQLRENAPERVVFNINALARTAKTALNAILPQTPQKEMFSPG